MKTKTKLEKLKIRDRKQLRRRISELKRQMESKEEQLQHDLKEVHASLRASNIIRNAMKDLREQPDLKIGLAQAATDMGAHALIDKLTFRKHRGWANYLLSVVLKKIADYFILKPRMNPNPK